MTSLVGTSYRLFGRQYLVTITNGVDTNTVARYGNIDPNPGDPSQSASPLRVEFDIVKNAKDSPNKGSIAITNMSSVSRRSLRPGMQVTLYAGYTGVNEVLFKAGLFLVKTERQGPDIITSMELMDGDAAIANITFDKTYGPGTAIKQIFLDMVAKLAVPTVFTPVGIVAGTITGLPDGNVGKGFSANGPLRQTMGDLCRNFGLEWSIQDGAIQINPVDQHIGDTGDLISKATGMLGVPSFDGTMLTVKTLLNPRLRPGRLIGVNSFDINGTFKIRGGHWKGDSHGDDWSVELECIPMSASAQALTSELGANAKAVAKVVKAATAPAAKSGKRLTSKTLGTGTGS